jgi:hypothetical protein
VGFVVDKAALGQVSPTNDSINFFITIITRGWHNRPNNGKCLSRKTFHTWIEKFSQGRSKVEDGTQPGAEVAETPVKKTCMLRVSTRW